VALFNESQSRIIISVAPESAERAVAFLRQRNVPNQRLGSVAAGELRVKIRDEELHWPIDQLYDDWYFAIERALRD
jgi:phosphoribosylformylglycinamidine synthase